MSPKPPAHLEPGVGAGGAFTSAAPGGEHPDTAASGSVRIPVWLWVLLVLSLSWGLHYIKQNGGDFNSLVHNQGDHLADLKARVPKSEAGEARVRGRRVYNIYCSACHQPHGKGIPGQFPPLADSEWVVGGGPNRLIRIVLNGMQGPVSVRSVEYNNVMLPWRDQLTDEDIAAVLTFVRGNKEWSHQASLVTPAQVKAIRDATASRGSMAWTAPELLLISSSD
jgi:mono/diheme cytochrome c family protein